MRLQAMRIPPCVRGAYQDLPAAQTFDLWIEAGDVISIAQHRARAWHAGERVC